MAVFWGLPIAVANKIGAPKNRRGWLWGLLLGWIGVAFVAFLGPLPGRRLVEPQQQVFTLQPATALAAVASPAAPAPGWYADPLSAGHVRYWDGSAWTHYAAAPDATS